MNKKKIIITGLGLLVLLILIIQFQVIDVKKPPSPSTERGDMIRKIKPYDSIALISELTKKCANSVGCLLDELSIVTANHGPQAALDSLDRLQAQNIISSSADYHQTAHEIGRQTAKNFGINQKAFLLCPLSAYNGGCQHGYFEYVLGKTSSQTEAANMICASLDDSFSSKFKFYCYHGVGHGVMMAQAYDLSKSLDVCDSLSETSHTEGCWQGVFMENTNLAMKGQAKADVFSENEPLAPCNKIEEKYRHQCFINHSGWLMRVFRNDIVKASGACLEAPSSYINSCIQSLGLMTTNPSWQRSIISGQANKSLVELGWEICKKFPDTHIDQCIIGGVDNIMNFNELSASEAASFCKLAGPKYKNLCYGKIGSNLRNQSNNDSLIISRCDTLEKQEGEFCKRGAGLLAN